METEDRMFVEKMVNAANISMVKSFVSRCLKRLRQIPDDISSRPFQL